AIPMELQVLYGFNNVWIPEYFNEYLAIAHQAPMKFYGMLNTKYIYADQPIESDDLSFIGKFNECTICYDDSVDAGIDGPYLYENLLYLPRAYMADRSILVMGDGAREAMYSLMLLDSFSPQNAVLVMDQKGKISDYSQEFLNHFDAILLTSGELDLPSNALLTAYAAQGGKVLPDIPNGKTEITQEEVEAVLSSSGIAEEIPIEDYSPNGYSITPEGSGFLVLSEKFFMFDAWKAKSSKELEMLRGNGLQTVIWVDTPEKITFSYESSTFRTGMIISIVTVILLVGLAIFTFFSRKKAKKHLRSSSEAQGAAMPSGQARRT
ncbi:MAG: hypothetical protein ABIH34_03675, partial [Nanoarchaeota archaeon]